MQEQERERVQQAGAEADPRAQEQEREQLRKMLRSDGKLGEPEVATLGPDIDAYVARSGDPEQMRNMVRATVREGCTDACLVSAVRDMNRIMSRGVKSDEAGRMVQTAAQEEHRDRDRTQTRASAEERGAAVHARVESQLERRDQPGKVPTASEGDRDRDREHDAAHDRDRDREHVHDTSGQHGGKH